MSEQVEPAVATSPGSRRGRSVAVWVVLVVAGLLLLLTSFAVWVNRVVLNEEVFVDTSSQLLEDDGIRSVVAARAVDELFDNVDVEAEIEDQLPSDLQSLSGPATAGLRQASYELVDRALERPAFQRLWAASLRRSHRTLVDVLEDDVPAFSTSGGAVTLDLEAIVLEAADRIGIRSRIEGKLPPDAGRIVILESDELDTAQNGFRILKTLGWALPVLALVAFGLAAWLAPDRRRVVRNVGVTVLVVGLVGLVATNVVGAYLVDALTSETDVREAAGNAWDILTELLRLSFRSLVVVGLLFLLAAWLAGPGRRALASRRALAPVLRERAWSYAALGVLALFLLLTGRVSDFTRLLFVCVLLALGVVWVELMRRQTLHEFPGASGVGAFAETRARLVGWWERQRAARLAREASGEPLPAAPTSPADTVTRLAQLAELHARGALTDEEYAAAKARVLAGG